MPSQPLKAQPQENTPPPQADSLGRAVRRNLHWGRICSLASRAAACVRTRGWQALGREAGFRLNLALHREVWKHRADIPLRREWKAQRQAAFAQMPTVSILVPVWRTPPRYFDDMVRSVLRQSYPRWQLVLADASTAPDTCPEDAPKDPAAYARAAAALPASPLEKRVARLHDKRIRYVRLACNEGIAGNTNRALAAADGEWLALLDHDDVLQSNALYEVVRAINEQGADYVYSDEIVLNSDLKKLVQYHFKPDWCPEQLQGCNYITHFSAFSRALLEKAGAEECSAYNGAQDYDLILRLTEKARRVAHVPKVLYIWRSHAASTASDISAKPYALEAGRAALEAHFDRIGWPAAVEIQPEHPGTYHPTVAVKGSPLVSVLIPSKDHADDLERCLSTLYACAGWQPLEVLVLENNSTDPATFAYYETAKQRYPGLQVLVWEGPFNFSAINNFGARHARGEHLLLLNNDIEVTTPGFVRELLSYSQQPGIGAVGGKLLYPDGTIQHAGVIVGIGGTAGHSHKGLPGTNGGDLNRLVTTQNYSAVTGACLMVKASLYRQLGGLDETRFAVAFNDVDFCLRLGEAGLRNVYTPYAGGVHYESKSRGYDTEGPNRARFERERAAFVQRWQTLLQQGDPCYNPHFTYLYENYGYK